MVVHREFFHSVKTPKSSEPRWECSQRKILSAVSTRTGCLPNCLSWIDKWWQPWRYNLHLSSIQIFPSCDLKFQKSRTKMSGMVANTLFRSGATFRYRFWLFVLFIIFSLFFKQTAFCAYLAIIVPGPVHFMLGINRIYGAPWVRKSNTNSRRWYFRDRIRYQTISNRYMYGFCTYIFFKS